MVAVHMGTSARHEERLQILAHHIGHLLVHGRVGFGALLHLATHDLTDALLKLVGLLEYLA